MNKVFKVIWNHATQTWTAVSELGHAKGKTKSKKIVKLTALAGAVIGSLAVSQSAMAASDMNTNDAVNIGQLMCQVLKLVDMQCQLVQLHQQDIKM